MTEQLLFERGDQGPFQVSKNWVSNVVSEVAERKRTIIMAAAMDGLY